MKEFIKKMLAENGDVSTMRVIAIGCFLVAAYLAVIILPLAIYFTKPCTDLIWAIGTFLTAAVGGKAGQKYLEKKDQVPEKPEEREPSNG